jgi:ATPase subunit of ABC transporter with duplicated ATPase domains
MVQTKEEEQVAIFMKACMTHISALVGPELTESEYHGMAIRIYKQEPEDFRTMAALTSKFTEVEGAVNTEKMQEQCKALCAELEQYKQAQVKSKLKPAKLSSLEKNKKKKADQEEADMTKKMAEFNAKKDKVPPPTVRHNKGKNFKTDIQLPVNIIVGGNHLIEDTDLQLVQGAKYGLIGRNGIGKTCLIDAISSADIEGFPKNIHTLQVEQEVEADEKTVLQHILDCDVERTELMEEMEELMNEDNDKK